MPTTAESINRLLESAFRVEFNGLPTSLVQAFNPGERKIKIALHTPGGQNLPSKQGGDLEYTEATLKMVVSIEGTDRTFWQSWMNEIQNPSTGIGSMPSEYYRDFSIYELRPDGNPSRAWEFHRAFPTEIKVGEKNGNAGDKNVIEEIRIAYEYYELREV